MNLNENTLAVFKNFSTINSSIYIKEGSVISTMAANKTVMARAKLDQEFPCSFGIFELSKFLGVLNLFKDPDIDITSDIIKISSDNKTIKYTCCDPKSIVSPPNKEIVMKSVDVQFTLEPEVFASVQKAISILGYSQFGICGENGKLYLQALNTSNPTGDIYSVEIGDSDKEFLITIRNDFLKLLPGTYNVKISKNMLSMFESDTVTYYIPVEQTSVFK